MKALEPFQTSLTILEPLTSWQDPIATLQLSYQPSPPEFTIRTIITAVESSKSPPFRVSIAQPLSLEERTRILHEKDLRRLVARLLSCVIVAIPTFIIGIVYMSLLPSGNAGRRFFEEPMWTGNSSRAQWAMFFLATPVMFYSATHFHRRSIDEIWALWRWGSKTPIWRRFVRFGSMNLLVRCLTNALAILVLTDTRFHSFRLHWVFLLRTSRPSRCWRLQPRRRLLRLESETQRHTSILLSS